MDREEKPEVVPGLWFFIISTVVLIMTPIYPVYHLCFICPLNWARGYRRYGLCLPYSLLYPISLTPLK